MPLFYIFGGIQENFMKHKLISFLLGIIFILPGLAALYFYYHPDLLKSSNQGSFLSKDIYLNLPHKKWKIVYWSNKALCQEACRSDLAALHNVHLALGRKYYYVDKWFIHPGSKKSIPDWQEKTNIKKTLPAALYIVTPANKVLLSYPLTAKTKIYNDLKKLLSNK